MSTIGFSNSALLATPRRSAAPAALAVRPRLRLTARGRMVFAVLIAIPLVAVALLLGFNAASAEAIDGASADNFTWVSVEPGQSLWQLAETVAPDADPREVVAEIVALNQLSSADVQAGQRLALPLRYTD